MNKQLPTLFLGLSVVGFLIGLVMTNSVYFGICTATTTITDAGCLNFYERVGDPLFFGMGALAIVFLVLLFMPRAYRAWSKFAVWYVPLAAIILIFLTPEQHGWINLQPSMEQTAQWLSGIYLLVSLTIVGWVHFRKP